jgi:hypothetical protein
MQTTPASWHERTSTILNVDQAIRVWRMTAAPGPEPHRPSTVDPDVDELEPTPEWADPGMGR